jgi:hypothetical protein
MIPQSWLQTPFTDEEIAALGTSRGRVPRRVRPWHTALLAFKAKLKPGDTLWSFDSPAEAWANLHGSRGLAIVRDGEVVETLIWMEN